jgi:hypothetical protein
VLVEADARAGADHNHLHTALNLTIRGTIRESLLNKFQVWLSPICVHRAVINL